MESNRENLSQLAAIIYSNSDENIVYNKNNILLKIIKLTLFKNNNIELSIDLLIDSIEDIFGLIFTEDEIYKSIKRRKKGFMLPNNFDTVDKKSIKNLCISLKLNEFKKIENKTTQNSLEKIIQKFYEDKYEYMYSLDQVNKIILDFLYNHFSNNLYNYKSLIDQHSNRYSEMFLHDIKENISFAYSDDKTRDIINAFIEYEDINKDKYIYYIITLAFEYSLTVNISSGKTSSELLNKNIYLDSNMIFRALGLNGENREKRITLFLDKCSMENQKLIITNLTEKEFENTLKYYTKDLDKYKNKSSNSYNYFNDQDIISVFLKEKDKNPSLNTKLFRAIIQNKYDNLKNKYNIEYVYIKDNSINKDSVKESELKKSLLEYKYDEKYRHINHSKESVKIDVLNTLYISKLNKYNKKIPTNIFISVDKRLLKWIKEQNEYNNFALLPSDWLSFMLRFSSRSKDEYKSFVELLKISPLKENEFEPIQIRNIINTVSIMTKTAKEEENILKHIMENDYEELYESAHSNESDNLIEKVDELVSKKMQMKLEKEKENYKYEKSQRDEIIKQLEIENKIKDKKIEDINKQNQNFLKRQRTIEGLETRYKESIKNLVFKYLKYILIICIAYFIIRFTDLMKYFLAFLNITEITVFIEIIIGLIIAIITTVASVIIKAFMNNKNDKITLCNTIKLYRKYKSFKKIN